MTNVFENTEPVAGNGEVGARPDAEETILTLLAEFDDFLTAHLLIALSGCPRATVQKALTRLLAKGQLARHALRNGPALEYVYERPRSGRKGREARQVRHGLGIRAIWAAFAVGDASGGVRLASFVPDCRVRAAFGMPGSDGVPSPPLAGGEALIPDGVFELACGGRRALLFLEYETGSGPLTRGDPARRSVIDRCRRYERLLESGGHRGFWRAGGAGPALFRVLWVFRSQPRVRSFLALAGEELAAAYLVRAAHERAAFTTPYAGVWYRPDATEAVALHEPGGDAG